MAEQKSGNGKSGSGLLGKVWDGVTGILTISQRLENHAKLVDEKLSGISKRLDDTRDGIDKRMDETRDGIDRRLDGIGKRLDETRDGIGKRLDEMLDSNKEMRGILISTGNMVAAINAGNEKIEKRLDNLSGRFEKIEGALIDRGVARQRSN
jgi:phage-related protein